MNLDKNRKFEFGDFQTPLELAQEVSYLVQSKLKISPNTIIEPTCGYGNFIQGAYSVFKDKPDYKANELNKTYINVIQNKFKKLKIKISFSNCNFFEIDWSKKLKDYKPPILFIGNPPWVTNSSIGKINGSNLPKKSNFQLFSGFEALTGKSNFDISEAMIVQILLALQNQHGVVAMLCKTTVARKIIHFAQKNKLHFSHSSIHSIPSEKYFNVSVSACLFLFKVVSGIKNYDCESYPNLKSKSHKKVIGFRNYIFLSNTASYKKNKNYLTLNCKIWRSGVKHDCGKIMELTDHGDHYRNGLGEIVKIDSHYVYPLFKSSDLANSRIKNVRKHVIVTQKFLGENTHNIKSVSKNTWNYLMKHKDFFSKRKSSIYRNQPLFCIFGVGKYSFAPWKVAISGLYKKLNFCLIGSVNEKPIILDDTCYFIPFDNKRQAQQVLKILCCDKAKEILNTLIFWDEKRPIKKSILDCLSIENIGLEIGISMDSMLLNHATTSRKGIEVENQYQTQLQIQ